MRILISGCFLLMSLNLFAESTLPAGCEAIKVQGQSVILKAKKSKLVFFHNLMENDIWIIHPVVNPSASAGWSSRIQEDNWSALVLKKSSFKINCIESRPGHEQQIPCEGAVALCQWKKIKIPKSMQGNSFWAAEDKSLKALSAAVGARGLIVPITKMN